MCWYLVISLDFKESASFHDRPPPIGHRASFGHAISIDFDYLIGVPNLDDTFDRGAFPLEDIRETSERVSSPSQTLQNILDRLPTPNLNFHPSIQGIARTGAGRSGCACSSHGDTTPNRAKQRQPIIVLAHPKCRRPGQDICSPGAPRAPRTSRHLPFRNHYGRRLSPLYVDRAVIIGDIHGTRLDGARTGCVAIDAAGIEGNLWFSKIYPMFHNLIIATLILAQGYLYECR